MSKGQIALVTVCVAALVGGGTAIAAKGHTHTHAPASFAPVSSAPDWSGLRTVRATTSRRRRRIWVCPARI